MWLFHENLGGLGPSAEWISGYFVRTFDLLAPTETGHDPERVSDVWQKNRNRLVGQPAIGGAVVSERTPMAKAGAANGVDASSANGATAGARSETHYDLKRQVFSALVEIIDVSRLTTMDAGPGARSDLQRGC